MDCFQDFCLYCDRDSPDGPYCTQQCKLADLERSNPSSPTSPTARQSWASQMESAYTMHHHHQHQHKHHRHQSTPSYDAPLSASSRPRSSYFMWNPNQQASQQTVADERRLTPSSSRTSLSSTSSSSVTAASARMCSQTQQQLQEYFGSFDQAKAAKRRSSLR